jgi:methylphosphotriester-DNA--protein-cysteine methyltransferase
MTLISGRELAQPLCDAHWKRLLDRDAAADGTFVYGVKTTGIYCRPSCPSRAPHRHNAVFFPTSRDAEADRYRACYRCNPDGLSTREVMAERIAEACRTIETADAIPTLAELAVGAGLSTFHFHRRFKAMTGLTPKAYAAAHRAKRVRTTLTEKMSSVTDAIYGAGFNSSSRFYETASERLGMTPKPSGRAARALRSILRPASVRLAQSWSLAAKKAFARSRWETSRMHLFGTLNFVFRMRLSSGATTSLRNSSRAS